MQATSLQPASMISRLAVDEADQMRRTGTTGKTEIQVIPCDLVTRKNASQYRNFAQVTSGTEISQQ
jgi:erythritol transport system substrate-binding protein